MQTLSIAELNRLAETSTRIRQAIIKMLTQAKSGHSAGSLGMADVLTLLYFKVLKHQPKHPNWPERDRLLISNGHICPVWYATLAEAGYFPKRELATLRQLNTRLQGHPHLGSLPGIENTGGPLGQGISQACGLAWALKLDKSSSRVFCVMSDGEQQEGQTWEAYQMAAKYELDNLTVLLDRNHIQIDGRVEEIMPIEPLNAKLRAFGWHVINVNGHDFDALYQACQAAQAHSHQPTVIVCHTVPGKGATFMENQYQWHGQAPSMEQAQQALKELRSLKGKVAWE